MIKVYAASSVSMAGYIKGALEAAGIACVIRNEFLSGGIGELPPQEAWPEVWIVEADAAVQARAIVAQLTEAGEPVSEWICAGCGETIEGQFGRCWKCGLAAPPIE